MSLDKDAVRNIAHLARIRVADEDLEGLAAELSRIIGWVEQLAEVDARGVAPMISVADMTLAERDDVITDGDCRDKVLANAPDRDDGFFAVPKVIE
jgi:aspartyl-tRNA(Asn)/glutamyl-tRNA(Gln) amidotransferase subunit C